MLKKAIKRKLTSIQLVSLQSFSKVKNGGQKIQAMGFSNQNITLHVHDDVRFSAEFYATGAQLRQNSWWEVFLEDNKWQ